MFIASALLVAAVACKHTPIPTVAHTQIVPTPSNYRGYRYCEVMPVFRDWFNLEIEVYSTTTCNLCPADLWSTFDATKLASKLGAFTIKANGPRYWLINDIIVSGDPNAGTFVEFYGMQMKLAATLVKSIPDALSLDKEYSENEVEMDKVFVYKAGNTVYELHTPKGETYIMQSYSQVFPYNVDGQQNSH
jgi:hypothetical protein